MCSFDRHTLMVLPSRWGVEGDATEPAVTIVADAARNSTPVSPRPRLWISLTVGVLAMLVAHMFALTSPVPRDFALFRQAAIAALHGRDVYAAVPGLAYPL